MTLRIRQFGDPILRQVSQPIAAEEMGSPALQALVDKMAGVLDGIKAISNENGNAVSAPQVGELKRLILLRLQGQFVPMINPEIVEASDERFAFDEECFSFYQLRGQVMRHRHIKLKFTDLQGTSQLWDLADEDAALAQHEIDHLDGVLFIDRVMDTHSVQSVDHLFEQNPSRLRVVKQLAEYMAAPLAT